MLTDVIKASKLTDSRKETIINKLCSTIGMYKDTVTDNIIFLEAKKYGIIYNIDANAKHVSQRKLYGQRNNGELFRQAESRDVLWRKI